MTTYEDQLLCRYLDGRLTTEEKDALQDLLRNSAAARKRLRLLATVTEGISGREVTPQVARIARKQSLIPWLIAAAATIMAVVGWMDRSSPEPERKPVTVNATDAFVALLVDEAGAEFAGENVPDDVRFQQGSYQLARGVVHVRFANGADVVMRAPVAFDIDDAFHIRLHHGGMRAIVPPSAQGFTVATPSADYEDFGTEFALSVDPDTGVSELHVIDGRVDAKHPQSKKLISSITGGQSVQFADGTPEQTEAPDLSRYPTPGSIGFLRWEQQRAGFGKDDSDLIGYYPFVESKQLVNKASKPVTSDGRIHGARWVSGRWPGKAALLFDRDTDFVELNVPGEYEELSLAAWLKIDRFDHSHSPVFISNGWSRGDVHWQIFRNQTMVLGYNAARIQEKSILKVVPTDQWIHVAATIAARDGQIRTYLNGEVAGKITTVSRNSIQPGMARIGNWLMEQQDRAPVRALRGRMDELAIWKRALTEAEVKVLVEKGRPTALWPAGDG